MAETFRDIIDIFPDRQSLAERWQAKVPRGRKVAREHINLWHHRNRIPGWAWSGLEAAAPMLGQPDLTMARLVAADHACRQIVARMRRAS